MSDALELLDSATLNPLAELRLMYLSGRALAISLRALSRLPIASVAANQAVPAHMVELFETELDTSVDWRRIVVLGIYCRDSAKEDAFSGTHHSSPNSKPATQQRSSTTRCTTTSYEPMASPLTTTPTPRAQSCTQTTPHTPTLRPPTSPAFKPSSTAATCWTRPTGSACDSASSTSRPNLTNWTWM